MRFVKIVLAATLALVTAIFLSSTTLFAANDANSANTNPATTTPTSNANVSPAERAKIEAVVHDYLVQKPEVLMEALQVLQRRQFAQAEKTVKETQQSVTKYAGALFRTPNDPTGGNPNGKITIVEFFDYQCPHCVDMAPVMDLVIKSHPELRIVYKEFPIRGPQSELAARAALAANIQGKYYPFYRALITSNKPITEDVIFDIAKTNGINVDKLKKDMNDKTVSDQIKANIKLAQDLKLFGTPAFFVGQTDAKGNISYIPGQITQAQMDDAISKAGK